jgi:hypothetical protein
MNIRPGGINVELLNLHVTSFGIFFLFTNLNGVSRRLFIPGPRTLLGTALPIVALKFDFFSQNALFILVLF